MATEPGRRLGRTVRERHRKIIAADFPPCHICNGDIDYGAHHYDPNSFTIDHITPIARGGTDTLDNLAAAHRGCNRLKSDKMPATTHARVTDRTW